MTKNYKIKFVSSILIGTAFVIGAASCASSKSAYQDAFEKAQQGGGTGNSAKDGAMNEKKSSSFENFVMKPMHNDVN